MVEFLKHLFGFCGEAHLNIFHVILGTPLISYIVYKIKILWKLHINKNKDYQTFGIIAKHDAQAINITNKS